ncbi:MAG: hypothetical protein NC401_18225 [Ruminococcus sp.]|nr:hypothetical protein [Ruminococcus sp.]
MKNILISCISLFTERQLEQSNRKTYTSNEGIEVSALQTNEACVKFLLKKLARNNMTLDTYIRVQSNSVEQSDFTMKYLDGSIDEFCKNEGLTMPEYFDCFLGEDEKEHRYDKVLSEISKKIPEIAGSDEHTAIYLDMAGGKRDNYIFIQFLTKLMSFYNYEVHTYYADITGGQGEIVNTDLSFRHMDILDAVNTFIQFGSVTPLLECFANSECRTIKDLLKVMEEFSNSVQLCCTDLTDIIPRLNQQIAQTEKNVSFDKDNLFMIGTMLPLIRKKFDIKPDKGSRGTLDVIKWCLENDLIQQALTIYNERAVNILFDEKIIVIDRDRHGTDIKRRMAGRHQSKEPNTELLCVVEKAFEKMYANPTAGSKPMERSIGRYKGMYSKRERDTYGNIVYHNLERTIGSVFWTESFKPDGVTININDELFGKVLSDISFATCARNRVNHASSSDTYDKFLISLFSLESYPFSSYPNTFTPKNVKKDLLRAVKNLEDALDA